MATKSHLAPLDLSSRQGDGDRSSESNERSQILSNCTEPPKTTRKRDLLLASALLFIPLLAITLIFLAFVFVRSKRVRIHFDQTHELPITPLDDSLYYTTESIGAFTLLGSWASTVAQLVLAPFMVLFSFLIAREIKSSQTGDRETKEVATTLDKLVGGELAGLWHWISYIIHSTRVGQRKRQLKSRAVHIAGLGILLAGLFSLLIVVGDNWLHLAVQPNSLIVYENITYPQKDITNLSDNDRFYAAGWTTIPECDSTLKSALPFNDSNTPLPCSLNNTRTGTYNIANPNSVYITLAEGITSQTYNFNLFLENGTDGPPDTQIVTYMDNVTSISHSFLFYPYGAYEYDPSPPQNTSFGIDYIANTTSLATKCTSVTKQCFSQPIPANQTILKIPFNCSTDFSGDLGQPSIDGRQRVQGWDSSFYEIVNGVPSRILIPAQSNPFTFFALASVDSLSFEELEASGDPQATEGSIIDNKDGGLAFALSCEATVYDITYSLINGNITSFNAIQSTASKASIIKAPLQAGYGRYNLYQSAVLGVLSEDTVANSMSKAFSQIGMALASGAFKFEPNFQQRFRYTLLVTEVPKAPLWFLITACLVYTVISVVALMAALVLRRDEEIARKHAELLPRYPVRMRMLLGNVWSDFVSGKVSWGKKGKKKEKARKEEGNEDRDSWMMSGDNTS